MNESEKLEKSIEASLDKIEENLKKIKNLENVLEDIKSRREN